MDEKIAFYFTEDGEYAPKEGLPFKKRHNVAAIIKYEKQYLFLTWLETNYSYSLVTGGIEEGEEKETAIRREVIEETGYTNIKNITPIDCINVSRFYVEHKKENREAVYYPYLVELNSLEKQEIDDAEKKEHASIWMSEDELDFAPLFENHRKMLNEALKTGK